MISSEVQRTIVKSPPELWAELSDPTALARHLGELGEIRIIKAKPEQSVEWEAEAAKGKVELQPSGWGTKVTLSVTLDMPDGCGPDAGQEDSREQADPAVEAQASTEPKPQVEPEGAREDPGAASEPPAAEPELETAAPEAREQVAPEPVIAEPAPKLGFFARLFRRRATTAALAAGTAAVSIESQPITAAAQTAGADSLPAAEAVAEPEVASAEQEAAPDPELAPDPAADPEMPQGSEAEPSQPAADLAAELAAGEEAIAAQTTELLTAVLDRLGSAHHRPFSRA
jgi:hypothetical protein